jgi:DNA-binding winged helix-turn-helix (wHTH) protein/TolB-like protein
MNASERPTQLRFGPFVIDNRRLELRRDGVPVPLRPKPFALLVTLASHPGTVLSKEELLAAVWPGVVVTDDSLAQAVHDVRTALGDVGTQFVRTVARRGYRFDGDVFTDFQFAVAPPLGSPARAVATGPTGIESSNGPSGTPASAVQSARQPKGRRRVVMLVVAIGTLAAGALLAWRSGLLVQRDSAVPPARSIVLLPLVHEGTAPDDDWFADALSGDLTVMLGQCPDTLVISRDTALTYKRQRVDARQAAKELNVRHVVQGTVRRDGDRVDLTLALVDGSGGQQQWAQRFTFERSHLRSTLDEAVAQIAQALSLEMDRTGGAQAPLDAAQVSAEDLTMRATALWLRAMTRDNLIAAARLYEDAVRLDPSSVRAWGGLAAVHGTALGSDWAQDRRAAWATLERATERLHALDANHYYTLMAKAALANLRGDWDAWLALAEDAVARFPNHAWAHFNRGYALMNLARFDECVEPTQRSIRLGPRDPLLGLYHWQIGTCHFFRREHAEAAARARQAQQANPTLTLPPLLLAASLASMGREEDARTIIEEFRERRPQYTTTNVERLLRSRHPRFTPELTRFISTLQSLGLR